MSRDDPEDRMIQSDALELLDRVVRFYSKATLGRHRVLGEICLDDGRTLIDWQLLEPHLLAPTTSNGYVSACGADVSDPFCFTTRCHQITLSFMV